MIFSEDTTRTNVSQVAFYVSIALCIKQTTLLSVRILLKDLFNLKAWKASCKTCVVTFALGSNIKRVTIYLMPWHGTEA